MININTSSNTAKANKVCSKIVSLIFTNKKDWINLLDFDDDLSSEDKFVVTVSYGKNKITIEK